MADNPFSQFADEANPERAGSGDNPFSQFKQATAETNPFSEAGPEPAEEGGLGKDLLASFGKGSNMLLETVGNAYGLFTGDFDNWATRQGKSGQEFYEGMESDTLRGERDERSRAIEGADGEWSKMGAAVWETVTNPRLFAATLAEQIPMFVGPAGAGAAAGRALGKAAGTVAGVGTGAALQSSDIGGTAYGELMRLPDQVWAQNPEYASMVADGVEPEVAKQQIATNLSRMAAAEAGGASLGSQLVPGGRALERATAGASTRLRGNRLGRGVGGATGEGLQEGIEEGSGQVAVNRAVQELDGSRGTFEGAGEAAGMGVLPGATLGGAVGLTSPAPEAQQEPVDQYEIDDALKELQDEIGGTTEADFGASEQRSGATQGSVFGPIGNEVDAQDRARAEGEELIRQRAAEAAAQAEAAGEDPLGVLQARLDAQRDGRRELDQLVPPVTSEQRRRAQEERELAEREQEVQSKLDERKKSTLDAKIAEEQKIEERRQAAEQKAAEQRAKAAEGAGEGGATAEQLGVTFPEGGDQPGTDAAQAAQEAEDDAIDDAIADADARGDNQKGIRLRNMKRMIVGARALRNQGKNEQAARQQERADKIYRELIGERRVVPYQEPAPLEGEYQKAEQVTATEAPQSSSVTITQQPARIGRETDPNTIRMPEPDDVKQRRERFRAADPVAREGVIQGNQSRPAQPPTPDVMEQDVEEITDESYSRPTQISDANYPTPPDADPVVDEELDDDSYSRPTQISDANYPDPASDLTPGYKSFGNSSLGVSRSEMPQIKSTDRGALANFLSARGVTSTRETVPADTLSPTQREYSPAKVAKAREMDSGRAVLVANDGRIIDGHHQWMAAKEDGEPVEVIRLSTDAESALELAEEFPSSTKAAATRMENAKATKRLNDVLRKVSGTITEQVLDEDGNVVEVTRQKSSEVRQLQKRIGVLGELLECIG